MLKIYCKCFIILIFHRVRRSTFENANILIVLHKRQIIEDAKLNTLLEQLDVLCRKITNFQKSLT